jgi:hypothetical protein
LLRDQPRSVERSRPHAITTAVHNVGQPPYQNREHCLSVARSDASEELSDDDCRYGVKAEDLNECMSHLRGASCNTVGGAFDSLGSMLSCQSRELCMD